MIQNKIQRLAMKKSVTMDFFIAIFIVGSETQDLNIILWSVPFLHGVKLSESYQSIEARYPLLHPLHALP